MKKTAAKYSKVALHAMDERSRKTMSLFLQGPCRGAAIVVNAEEADIDIYDADAPGSKSLLEKHLEVTSVKPVIVVSLQEFVHEGVLYLKKPVKTDEMLAALDQAKALLKKGLSQQSVELKPPPISKDPGKDMIDLFDDELFDLISSSTSSWDDEPVAQGPAEKLKEVYAPVKQEPKAPEASQEVQAQEVEEKAVIPVESILEPEAVEEVSEEQAAEFKAQEAMVSDGSQLDAHQSPENQADIPSQPIPTVQADPEISVQPTDELEVQELKTFVRNQESDKTSKHQAAMFLDEKSFDEYMGFHEQSFFNDVDGVDKASANDPKRLITADYDPNEYFQGCFQHILSTCKDNMQPIMLQSSWHPIAVFPLIQEVWLNATDLELKAFAEIKFKNKAMLKEISVSRINIETMNMDGALDKFHSIQAFMWKLACWTSKGRYPRGIDYQRPVYLTHWPNFTRLLVTPHALRIVALLIKGPRTMINVAETLNIKPQYVFLFISAANAIGLIRQVTKSTDNQLQQPSATASKSHGLLGRILNRLRSGKA